MRLIIYKIEAYFGCKTELLTAQAVYHLFSKKKEKKKKKKKKEAASQLFPSEFLCHYGKFGRYQVSTSPFDFFCTRDRFLFSCNRDIAIRCCIALRRRYLSFVFNSSRIKAFYLF
jgi:hypothetical protein